MIIKKILFWFLYFIGIIMAFSSLVAFLAGNFNAFFLLAILGIPLALPGSLVIQARQYGEIESRKTEG